MFTLWRDNGESTVNYLFDDSQEIVHLNWPRIANEMIDEFNHKVRTAIPFDNIQARPHWTKLGKTGMYACTIPDGGRYATKE